jgi:outer membrane receptor protein involved in Fe transport
MSIPPALTQNLLFCSAVASALLTITPGAWAQSSLTSLSLEQLMDVTIVGASKYEQKQSEVAAAVSVITRQEIKSFGWRTLAEALASLPGVYTTYDRQYTYLGTRGFGLPGDLNTRVLLTINGMRVNDPVYDGGLAGREFPLDLELVERIEFIPGPGGAVYGANAMFGVVNVITRTGAGLNGMELTAATQSPQAQVAGRATWGKVLNNGVDILLSASGLNAQGTDHFLDFGSTGISGVASGQDGENVRQFFARAAWGAWSAGLIHGDRRKNDPTGAFLSDPLVPGQFIRDTFWLARAQYQDRFFNDSLQVSGRLFSGSYQYFARQNYGTEFIAKSQGDWVGADWRLVSTVLADHKLMAGIELQDNRQINLALLDTTNPLNNVSIQKSGWRVGLYAQDEWRITPNLAATLGLRVDRTGSNEPSTSPRLALIWQALPSTTVKALAGRAYRTPNSYELDFADGVSQVANPTLKSETIETLELVADHRVDQNLRLRASIYQWELKNLITLGVDPASSLAQYQSGAPVTARGLELSADHTWVGGSRLRGSLSFQNAAYNNGGGLVNSPKLLGKLNFSSVLPFAGLRLGYELQYDSQRRSLNGSLLEDVAISNLHLTTDTLANGLELSLGIFNLFDRRYALPAADSNWQNTLEQDGRSVRFQMLYKF